MDKSTPSGDNFQLAAVRFGSLHVDFLPTKQNKPATYTQIDGSLVCSVSPFLQLLLKLIGHGVGKGESRVEACGSRGNLDVMIFQRLTRLKLTYCYSQWSFLARLRVLLDTPPPEIRLSAVLDSDQVTLCLHLHKLYVLNSVLRGLNSKTCSFQSTNFSNCSLKAIQFSSTVLSSTIQKGAERGVKS